MTIFGTAGNDHLSGTTGNDDFDVSQGGNDVVRGKSGDNSYAFGAAYTLADTVQGGGDFDGILLNGFYGSPIVFGANITSVEQISIVSDLNYIVTMRDAAVTAGRLMNFDGGALDVGNHFTLDASAESDGVYFVTGSSGDDIIKVGAGADLAFGGNGDDRIFGGAGADFIGAGFGSDTIYGGDDVDTILFEGDGAFDSTDRVFGGSDIWPDGLELDGDYSGGLIITKDMVHLDAIQFDGGHSYLIDANGVAAPNKGGPYIYDSSDLGSGDFLVLDCSGAKDGIIFYGGDGHDEVRGSIGYNTYEGGGGADVLTGNKSFDVFNYFAVSDSTGSQYDTIIDFDAGDDFFFPQFGGIDGAPASFGGRIEHGSLDSANFNHDLARNVGEAELAVDGAVLFKAKNGDLAGKWFLVVDGNSTAGYQANHDLVVLLDSPAHVGQFDIDNFGTAG